MKSEKTFLGHSLPATNQTALTMLECPPTTRRVATRPGVWAAKYQLTTVPLPNFNYGDRYPNATAQLVATTRTVGVGGTMVVVSVFVNHTPAHQRCECQQPDEHDSWHCFHGTTCSQRIANAISVAVTRSTDRN